jgi:DNA invertase Pin-like site-specific DNA recombinase
MKGGKSDTSESDTVTLPDLRSETQWRVQWFPTNGFKVSREQFEGALLYARAASKERSDQLRDPLTLKAVATQLGLKTPSLHRSLNSFNENLERFALLQKELVMADFGHYGYGRDPSEVPAKIRERRRRMASKGMWPFEVPIGYKIDRESKILQVDPKWGPFVKSLFERVSRGEKPRAVAQELGMDLSRGKWSKPYDILHSPVYKGMVEHKGEAYRGKHQALVDPETWGRVQWLLKARGKRSSARPRLFGLLWDPKRRGFAFDPGEARLSEICRLFIQGISVRIISEKLHVGSSNVLEVLTHQEYSILGDLWRQANRLARARLAGAKKARGKENTKRVLKAVLEDPEGKTTKSMIVKETGLSHSLVAHYLQDLRHKRLVSNTRRGFGKLTRWNVTNPGRARVFLKT